MEASSDGIVQSSGNGAAARTNAASARDVRGPSPLVAVADEAVARLIVDPPLAEPLAEGRVFIQYRTENLRVLPVFGAGALAVSPRVATSTSPSTMRRGISSTHQAKPSSS